MKPERISTSNAPTPGAPYSQATRANGFVFVTGQLSRDPKTGKFVEGPFGEQFRRSLTNLKGILDAAGCDADDVVKLNIYMTKHDDLADMNAILGEYFPNPPARSSFGVSALWMGAAVMIDAIAVSN